VLKPVYAKVFPALFITTLVLCGTLVFFMKRTASTMQIQKAGKMATPVLSTASDSTSKISPDYSWIDSRP
jgi:hypothetical protein